MALIISFITKSLFIDGDLCPNGWNDTSDCTYGYFDNSIYGSDIEGLKDGCYAAVKQARISANESGEELESMTHTHARVGMAKIGKTRNHFFIKFENIEI